MHFFSLLSLFPGIPLARPFRGGSAGATEKNVQCYTGVWREGHGAMVLVCLADTG